MHCRALGQHLRNTRRAPLRVAVEVCDRTECTLVMIREKEFDSIRARKKFCGDWFPCTQRASSSRQVTERVDFAFRVR